MSAFDRRELLRLIAAGAAASMAGCSRPRETIEPMVNQPDGDVPGQVRRYATALPLAGYLRGVTGLVVDGRPIKLEGLATHPASLGATDVFTEASILDLYDPQRLKAVRGPDGPANWDEAARAIFERMAPRGGAGLVVLTGRVTSPTLLARLAALKARWPGARHVRWEPLNDDNALAGAQMALGQRLVARPRLAEADLVVCLGADPLGPGPEQVALARAWAERRGRDLSSQLIVVESSPTQTGVVADSRIVATPAQIAAIAAALARGQAGGSEATASRLLAHVAAARDAGDRVLILGGVEQPAEVHAAVASANMRLGAPLDWIAPIDPDPIPHAQAIGGMLADMRAGRIDTLVVLDANPAYAMPEFAQALGIVPLSLCASRLPTETAARCHWSLPLSHPLEGWHDGRAPDGTASIAQPLVHPFGDTRMPSDVVDVLLDPAAVPASFARVRDTWASLGEAGWKQALVTGVVPNTAATPATAAGAAPFAAPPVAPQPGFVIEVRPSPALFDGRFSANAWAQECPDPITKEVWGASARMAPEDMARLGLANGDTVRITRGDHAITLSARGIAGQAAGVVTLLAGYGRSDAGAVANGIGANALAFGAGPATLEKGEGAIVPPSTQHQFALPGELAKLFPVVAPGQAIRRRDRLATLLPNPPARHTPTQWAMAIDTDVCIGCNACVVACQAENNVPAIGPDEVAAGRDMHWLRIDRYAHTGGGGFQPVPCMQCEAAPCEPVCPVEASVHDAQGLNAQVYNRCVGTRTCQANCPYKVRHFNFHDYADANLWGDAESASVTAQRNPDVTVRARGVMEKCTYCVQRIERATREADAGGTPGPVVTACQAACPTRAISFGPLDGEAIGAARADPRHYALLEELGTRPRTTYLAKRRNIA